MGKRKRHSSASTHHKQFCSNLDEIVRDEEERKESVILSVLMMMMIGIGAVLFSYLAAKFKVHMTEEQRISY